MDPCKKLIIYKCVSLNFYGPIIDLLNVSAMKNMNIKYWGKNVLNGYTETNLGRRLEGGGE